MKISLDNIRRVAQYIGDKQGDEMIESPGYQKSHLSLNSPISQRELDAICEMFNTHVLSKKEDGRLYNHMGELIYSILASESESESMMSGNVFKDKLGHDDVTPKIRKILVEMIGCEEDEIIPSAHISDDLYADSLESVEIIMAIEEDFGFEIPDEEAEQLKTVQDIITYVNSRKDREM